jgi:glycosyltransferase involved in cell wall biosynthesis
MTENDEARVLAAIRDPRLPLVAVCTPVHDGEAFLAETMDAVQAQTYPNVIHCVSENASTDSTPEILARYRDARVPVIASPTGTLIPMMPNWNRAATLSPPAAKWVRWLNADDWIAPDCIERSVAVAESDPEIALVGCSRTRNRNPDDFLWPKDRTVFGGAEATRMYFEYKGTLMGPHIMARRDVLFRDGPAFDESIIFADNDMCLRVLRHGKFGFVHEVVSMTREHETASTTSVMDYKRLHFFEWMHYLDRYGPDVYTPEAFAALRKTYVRHYLRRMLTWPKEIRAMHRERLAAYGDPVTPAKIADALANWVGKKTGFQRGWVGYPF